MNQYAEKNAAEKIDGYYMTTPSEDASKDTVPAVERARAQCVAALRQQIECIEGLSADKFYVLSGRKVAAPVAA